MRRFILWTFFLAGCLSIMHGVACGQTGWSLTRNVMDYDRYELTTPDTLHKIRNPLNNRGLAGIDGWGITGWFEYDFSAPWSGWYELIVTTSGSTRGVEYLIDPKSYHKGVGGLYIYGSDAGFDGKTNKISNLWLEAGTHTLRLQRYYWTGFPPITHFTLKSSDTSLAETFRATLSNPRTIYRKSECGYLEIFSGGRLNADKLTVLVRDLSTGVLRDKYAITVPASKGPTTQQIPLYCRQEGTYSISFSDAVGRPISKRDIGEINYEIVNTTQSSRHGGKIAKTLIQEIDCATTPPDYADGGGTRVIHKPFGSYRESGDHGWMKYQQLNEHLRKFIPEPSWFAYKLNITAVQHPYFIEVDYPDDKVRTFVIALRESDPLAYPVAGGVDSGGEFSLSNKILTHTLLYWPRAANTRIAFMTAHTGMRAAASKIRVYRIDGDLPALHAPVNGGRNFANWYEEGANFLSMYGAPDDSIRGFRVATERWARAVAYVGGNVLSPTVVAYNFALYPSRYNEAFSTPPDNDVLRRMLLISEKYGMKLLPELHPRADELAWPYSNSPDPKPNLLISKDGKTLNNLPPYYNPIYPANQEWYVNMIGELVDNYKDSPALLGVSLRLMQWQNPTLNNFQSLDWGYDDYTVSLFQKETGIAVPGTLTDPTRYRKRYDWLMTNARERWISWRCEKITQLYTRIRNRVRQARSDLNVFLTAFDGYPAQFGASWLREAGIDPQMLSQIDGVKLINALHSYGRRYDRETSQGTRDNLLDPDVLRALNAPGHSGRFLSYARYFEATEVVLPPEKLGFHASAKKTWMSAVINPAGKHFLERYAVELAETDASWLGDGGNSYTLGQPQLRDFLREYRLLPSVPFIPRHDARDPVAIWELPRATEYLFYAVNRERFPVTVELRLNGAGHVYRLSNGQKMISPKHILKLHLQPYQLVAFKASKGIRIASVTTTVPVEDLRRVTTQVHWLEQLDNDVQNRRDMPNLSDPQKLKIATTQARTALDQGHVWRARTIMENHELLLIYRSIGRYPPYLRDDGGAGDY